MQAILTRYHGATNKRPARVTARCQIGSVTINADDVRGDAHVAAANALRRKLSKLYPCGAWNSAMVGGQLPNGDYVFVFRSEPYAKLSKFKVRS